MIYLQGKSGTPRNANGMPEVLKTLEKLTKKAWHSVFQKEERPPPVKTRKKLKR